MIKTTLIIATLFLAYGCGPVSSVQDVDDNGQPMQGPFEAYHENGQ